jgi:DEAD/DEAH box helicase domain-containing protein
LIDQDGSGRGQRHFLVYNPPVLDEAIGLRKSSLLESVRLAQDLLVAGVQGVVFARSRRSVEMILKYLQESGESKVKNIRGADHSRLSTLDSLAIRGYRSGYLPSQRREIEKGLRDGSVRLVIATNGLELGIDIGGLETALLVGYPGTIASTWQQAGRAGRGDGPAAAVLIASANPIDQFLAHHPDYFFGRSPEQALINPDHLLILLNHLRCAMFELPFTRGETFGGNPVDEFLDVLAASHDAHLSQDKYYWMADSYPAANISLRSASPESYVLQVTDNDGPNIIGIVDGESAFWMTHPGAVYLHEARQYFVEDLDREKKIARLRPLESDYFTEPLKQTTIQVLSIHQQETIFDTRRPPAPNVGEGSLVPRHPSPVTRSSPPATHAKGWGELQVTTQVTGFRKLRWYSRENLGEEPLDLPPTDLQTTGYWLSISDETVEQLSKEGLWTNAPNDYGPGWNRIREAVRQRDSYRCQVCGRVESNGRQHAVHHKIPFRYFMRTSTSSRSALERQDLGTKPGEIALREVRNPKSPDFGAKSGDFALREASYSLENVRTRANDPGNLTTLCTECHQKVEANVRIRSGLAGLAYALGNLALLFLMCDPGDLGTHVEPVQSEAFPQPSAVLYDLVPAGIGFSQKLFEMHAELLRQALELVSECSCEDGCPSCVGPGGENGMGGKAETLSLLKTLVGV